MRAYLEVFVEQMFVKFKTIITIREIVSSSNGKASTISNIS